MRMSVCGSWLMTRRKYGRLIKGISRPLKEIIYWGNGHLKKKMSSKDWTSASSKIIYKSEWLKHVFPCTMESSFWQCLLCSSSSFLFAFYNLDFVSVWIATKWCFRVSDVKWRTWLVHLPMAGRGLVTASPKEN